MKAYSLDLRQRIVEAVDEGCTAEDAAALFESSPATVRRYLRQRRLEGTLAPKTSPGRPRLIRQADNTALRAQIAAYPDSVLEEHCVLWKEQTGQAVSVSTMCRALARFKLFQKKDRLCPGTRRRGASCLAGGDSITGCFLLRVRR